MSDVPENVRKLRPGDVSYTTDANEIDPWFYLCPACGGDGQRKIRNLIAELFDMPSNATASCSTCHGRGTVIQ